MILQIFFCFSDSHDLSKFGAFNSQPVLQQFIALVEEGAVGVPTNMFLAYAEAGRIGALQRLRGVAANGCKWLRIGALCVSCF